MSGPKSGAVYLKKSCKRCRALIPSDDPTIKGHYKCCLGIQLVWQNVDASGAFYCPLSPCSKPTTEVALRTIMAEMQP